MSDPILLTLPTPSFDALVETLHGAKPMRVEIPAYTDRWMMGDRYGVIVKISRNPAKETGREIAHVKLDVSGRTMSFWLDDCRAV